MKDYFTNEPATTPNQNVPQDALLLGNIENPREDFYLIRYDPPHTVYGHWALWRVTDQPGDEPKPVTFGELSDLHVLDGKLPKIGNRHLIGYERMPGGMN